MAMDWNNWLNLRATDAAWQGLRPAPSQQAFAEFNTPEEGVRAAALNLLNYPGQGADQLGEIINMWAPAGDGANDPNAYVNSVSQQTGWSADQYIDVNDPGQVAQLFEAMGLVENGQRMDRGVIDRGVQMGLGSPRRREDRPEATAAAPTPQEPGFWDWPWNSVGEFVTDPLISPIGWATMSPGDVPDMNDPERGFGAAAGDLAYGVAGTPADALAGIFGWDDPFLGSSWLREHAGGNELDASRREIYAAEHPGWVPGNAPAASEDAAAGINPLQSFYDQYMGGTDPINFSVGGGTALPPPPDAPLPAQPNYDSIRSLLAQGKPEGRKKPAEDDELMTWLSGLSGALGYDEPGEILLGAGGGVTQAMLGRREELREEDYEESNALRQYYLGNAGVEAELVGAETAAANQSQQIEANNRLQQWQFTTQQALARNGTVSDITDRYIVHQAVGANGETEISYIPLSGTGIAAPTGDPTDYARTTLGLDPTRQPQAYAAAVTAFTAASSGVADVLADRWGHGEAYTEKLNAAIGQLGGDAKPEDINNLKTQLLMQMMLSNQQFLADAMQMTGVDMSGPAAGGGDGSALDSMISMFGF